MPNLPKKIKEFILFMLICTLCDKHLMYSSAINISISISRLDYYCHILIDIAVYALN